MAYQKKKYTSAQKAAYYKKLYLQSQKRSYQRKTYKRKYYKHTGRTYAPKTVRQPRTVKVVKASDPWGDAGSNIGMLLGKGAHALFKMVTGFGDYTVEQNSLMQGGMSPPEIANSSLNGGFIVRHREFLGNIAATTSFSPVTYTLNPADQSTFPWLSQIAGSFEEYQFRGIIFEFKSTSSDAVLSTATSSALGSVSMATQYDVLDAGFDNQTEMLNYVFANSCKPSCTFIHPVECKKSMTVGAGHLYIREGGNLPPNADARFYDLGVMTVATEGMQAASGNVGQLWVTYECELFKNKYNNTFSGLTDKFKLNGTIGGSTPLGTSPPSTEETVESNLGGSLDLTGVGYVFPAGVPNKQLFLFTYFISSSSTVTLTAPLFTSTNCDIIADFGGTAFTVCLSPINGSTTGRFLVQFIVQINITPESETSPGEAEVFWGVAGTIPNGNQAADLTVTRINSLGTQA